MCFSPPTILLPSLCCRPSFLYYLLLTSVSLSVNQEDSAGWFGVPFQLWHSDTLDQPLSLDTLWVSIQRCVNWPHLLTAAWFRLQLSETLSLSAFQLPLPCLPYWPNTLGSITPEQILYRIQELQEFPSGGCWMCVALIHKFMQFQKEKCSAES